MPVPAARFITPTIGKAAGRSREASLTAGKVDDYATRYEVELSPLPAFRHLSPKAYREKVAELVREIEEE